MIRDRRTATPPSPAGTHRLAVERSLRLGGVFGLLHGNKAEAAGATSLVCHESVGDLRGSDREISFEKRMGSLGNPHTTIEVRHVHHTV